MRGLVLNWDSAHCVAHDEASRNMRSRRAKNPKLKERWSHADSAVYVAKLEHLVMVWYRSEQLALHGPVDIREAWMLFAETRGQGVRWA